MFLKNITIGDDDWTEGHESCVDFRFTPWHLLTSEPRIRLII